VCIYPLRGKRKELCGAEGGDFGGGLGFFSFFFLPFFEKFVSFLVKTLAWMMMMRADTFNSSIN